jgi:hypothetical protein
VTYTATDALIDALATYRATKLVIDDEITAEVRERAYQEIERLPKKYATKLRYFLGCPWCVSIWAAGFLVGLRILAPNLAQYLNTLLAASAVTGVVYTKVG